MNRALPKFVKLYLLPPCLLFIIALLFIPAILNASRNANDEGATVTPEHQGFLPIILKYGSSLIPTVTLTPSPSATTTATYTATPESGGIMFVVGDTALNNGDTAVYNQLINKGYSVTVVDDSSANEADAAGRDLIIISSTVNAANVGINLEM